jgi:hypothetical protein
MRKPLISLTLWTAIFGSAAAVACSAADPGVGYLGLAHSNTGGSSSTTADAGAQAPASSSNGSSSGSTPTPSGGGGGSSGGATSTPDAGAPSSSNNDAGTSGGGADSGASEGGSTASAFLGEATPWASAPIGTTALQHHAATGQAPQSATTPCLGCHTTGGSGAPFLAAGFVATAAGGTTGAGDVEVRVYAQGGTAAGYSAHTDSDGFFWINPPNGGTTGPYQAGVRDGTTTHLMPAAQASANCQTCHAGSTGVIHM